ncbi:MAG: hypothetical protein U0797_26685 [Gemmataceae bacterium]
MPDINDLASRIDAEFTAFGDKRQKAREEQVKAYEERKQRLEKLGKVFAQLQEVWRPRLELLKKKFGDRVDVTPNILPSTREATFEFQSKLARVRLTFTAGTDRDVSQLVLTSDLSIVPALMQFDSHSERAFPLDAVDPQAVASWVDDRVVSFVKTYMSLHEQDQYLKDEMVEDPVAGVRFPRLPPAAARIGRGQTYYFVGEETPASSKARGAGRSEAPLTATGRRRSS